MPESRIAIPASVKRALRRESWFGCCRCGSPLVEYHHILGYATTGHDAEQMMILCPNCHHLATVGALQEDEQRRLKRHSFNRIRGYARGLLYSRRQVLALRMGSNLFLGDGYKIIVDGEALVSIRIEDECILLTAKLYDPQDALLCEIRDNEWISGAPEQLDILAKPQQLALSLGSRRLLGVKTSGSTVELSGHLFRRGIVLRADGDWFAADSPFGYRFAGIGFFDMAFRFETDSSTMVMDAPCAGESSMFYMLSGRCDDQKTVADAQRRYKEWRKAEASASDRAT